jgi:hypothetical protein
MSPAEFLRPTGSRSSSSPPSGSFDRVGEEFGFDIDEYAIQHEMSTHHGRLVTTDDALMLFSDPDAVLRSAGGHGVPERVAERCGAGARYPLAA